MKNFLEFFGEPNTDLLLEGRIDFLKASHKDKLNTDHDAGAVHKDSDAIVDFFAQHADPSTNKQNTQWILKQYVDKKIRQEDAGRVHAALTDFEAAKNRLPEKRLEKYPNVGAVETAAAPFTGTANYTNWSPADVPVPGVEKIHDAGNLKVFKITSEEGAHHWGENTKWCTRKDYPNCQAKAYLSRGNLYVTQDKTTGERHQMHFEDSQFADLQDDDVGLTGIIKRHPDLKKIEHFKPMHPIFNSGEENKKRLASILSQSHGYKMEIARSPEHLGFDHTQE